MDELIDRAVRGEANAEELAELARWRAADAENEQYYRRTVRLLEAAAELRSELEAPTVPRPTANDLLTWRPRNSRTMPNAFGTRSRWAQRLPWAVAAAAMLVLAFNLARPGAEPRDLAMYSPPVIVTGVGEIVTVQLGDGSAVRLAPSSRLRLADGGDPRAVELEGRAFFSVARVKERPFRVRTRGATATVLGTRFEIATDEDDLRLVVVEGRVALETEQNRVEVGAGEASGVANRVAAEPTRITDVNDVLRWTGRFLAFQDTPLRDAAREIESTYDVRIEITDNALAARTITAVFTGQSLEAVLDVTCSIVNAHCAVRDDEVTMSLR